MESTRNLTSTAVVGSANGSSFDDKSIITDIGKAAITKIIFSHGPYVQSLTVHYGSQVAVKRGTSVSILAEVVLEPGTYITCVRGNCSGGPISDLRLESNTGKTWGPYGSYAAGSTSSAFDWRAPSKDMGLLYFSGMADSSYIWQLQATWAKYSPVVELPPSVNYEEHMYDDSSTQPPVILSNFARNLMSPVVTLLVGEEGIEFHACESIVCSLPFFRSAFQGGFKEATEKKISMPEDEPEIVSALIEFLYNGNYTYAYDPRTVGKSDGTVDATEPPIRTLVITEQSDRAVGKTVPPVGDLREGAFHVRVYALASKYNYQPLIKAAVKSFIYILLQLKEIDVVRHWKTAYGNGLYLSDWEDDESLAGFKKGLGKLLKDLYVAHRVEMDKTFAECPALGTDFLRVAVCSGAGA